MSAQRNVWRTAAVCLVGVLGFAAHATGSDARTPQGERACSPNGATTLVKNATGRVGERKGLVPLTNGVEFTRGARVYGCLYARGKRVLLGFQRSVDGNTEWINRSTVRLSGPFVAYARGFDDGAGGGADLVQVRNLRTGRLVHSSLYDNFYGVLDLELRADGTVAWISKGGHSDGRAVLAWTPAGGERVLSSGEDINGRSLVLRGATVSWTKGGVPMSASLD